MIKLILALLILNAFQVSTSLNDYKEFLQSPSEAEEDDVVLMATQDITINLYTLISTYEKVLKIPKSKLTFYQIPEGTNGKYRVTSGSSVSVNSFGTITPRNTTWYWYGGWGYTSPDPTKTPSRIEVKYNEGTSVVTATVGDKTYKITVNVKEYSKEYVDAKINDYIKKNVTVKTSQLDKLKAITAYPAQFPYNGSYYTYTNMIIYGGGDCWASSGLIQYMCQKVGIKSHIRYAANDVGAGSGHRNVAALINGKIYIADAGYGSYKPNRPYSVTERNVGYSYRTKTDGIVIYQYDGYDVNITVPSKIDGKTVIGLDKNMFKLGASNSGIDIKKIIIPDTIRTIGNQVFNSIPSLTTITIPKNVSSIGLYVWAGSDKLATINVIAANPYFSSANGILYNKAKTEIVAYPPGKKANYAGIASLTKIGDFAFYYAKQIEKVSIPKSVKSIGEGAFAYSTIKEIYFMGDQPEFGSNCFYNLNVTVYYPKGNTKWKVANLDTYKAKEVRWVQWTPSSNVVLNTEINNNSNYTWALVTIGIFLLLGFAFLFRRNAKRNNSIVDMPFKTDDLVMA